jgi:hypothetical protein
MVNHCVTLLALLINNQACVLEANGDCCGDLSGT